MKTIKITLRQTDDGQFRVEKFSNTAQLSIGQLISRDQVSQWTVMNGVDFQVAGRVEDESNLMADGANVLELSEQKNERMAEPF